MSHSTSQAATASIRRRLENFVCDAGNRLLDPSISKCKDSDAKPTHRPRPALGSRCPSDLKLPRPTRASTISFTSMGRPVQYLALLATLLSFQSNADAWVAARNDSSVDGSVKLDVGIGCKSSKPYFVPDANATQPRFSYLIENPLAEFISVHFTAFNLPANDYIVIRPTKSIDPKDAVKYRGDEVKKGNFFSDALTTKSVTVELYTTGQVDAVNPFLCKGFSIDSYNYLATPQGNPGGNKEEVCGSDNSREAACFANDPTVDVAFKKADAVARLLTHKGSKSFYCSGWLLGCEGHIITNNHCIANQDEASNTQFEFHAQGASCSTKCSRGMGCPSNVRVKGGKLVIANPALDYALVKLDINLSNDYGYLQFRDSGADLKERIYIPQHPAGWGKRIAMKTDSGYGRVDSTTLNGCTANGIPYSQVGYTLDTQGGSSGSPVIAWDDQTVVALHHCGGCPNTAISAEFIVADLRNRNLLPNCAVYSASTPSPAKVVATPAPTPAPTPAQAPVPAPKTKTIVDGTLTSTATATSVDYVDFTLTEQADVELDILSMEAIQKGNDVTFVDLNGDCNAGFIDSSIALFRLDDNNRISESTVISINDEAPDGYGMADGSQSSSDSYMFLNLNAGRYRLAVGAAPMTVTQAVAKQTPISKSPRVCDVRLSNYGSYRLTISTTSNFQVTNPNSYIGSQCTGSNNLTPYTKCPYHKESSLARSVGIDGTIQRQSDGVTVDHIPFTVQSFSRVIIDSSSYARMENSASINVNGNCDTSYIDPVMYLFRRQSSDAALTPSELVNAGDDDDNFALRKNRRALSFRDPYISLALPSGDYVLMIGRYPMSARSALDKFNTASPSDYTPETCGEKTKSGNYMVTFNSTHDLTLVSPNSFTGSKCPNTLGKPICLSRH